MRRGGVIGLVAFAAVLLAQQAPAHAVILNYGIDITDNNGSTIQGPFYAEDPVPGDGRFLTPGQSYTVVFDPTAVFAGYIINSATLFVDANFVESSGSLAGKSIADISDVLVQGGSVGALADNGDPSLIPLIAGGVVLNNDFDTDSSFYTLSPAQAAQLASDATYTIVFKNNQTSSNLGFLQGGFILNPLINAGRTFRVEGLNLQADATLIEKPGQVHTPEPASMLLFGLGGLGFGFAGRRKRAA